MKTLLLPVLLCIFSLALQGQQYTNGLPITGQNVSQAYYHEQEITIKAPFSSAPGFSAAIRPYINTNLLELNRPAVISHVVRRPGLTTSTAVGTAVTGSVTRSYSFLDAFGRLGQTVVKDYANMGTDLVQPQTYEMSFRGQKSYLPYTASYNGDSFRSNALKGSNGYADSEQRQYYLTPPANVTGAGASGNAFSEIRTEDFGGRPLEQAGPGEHHKLGSGHTVTSAYTFNGISELRQWQATTGGLSTAGYYDPAINTIYKTVSVDGDGQTSISYSDVEGRLLASTKMLGSTPLTTYYVYDGFDRLAYVIPPLPAELGSPSSIEETDHVFKNFLYAYRYDKYGRVTEKHMPSQGWTELVYNKRNQAVLTQNAVQKAEGKWSFAKYDANDRAVYSGIYLSADSRETLQNMANSYTGALYESAAPATGMGYTDVSFPTGLNGTNGKIHTVDYYDHYNFLANTNINNQTDAAVFTAPLADTLMKVPEGMVTGRLVNVLGTGDYLLQVLHYDQNLNVVRTMVQHYYGKKKDAGNYEVNTTLYNFVGEPVKETKTHAVNKSTGTAVTNIETLYSYDHIGRLQQLLQKYDGSDPVVLESYSYNELGQLAVKKLHAVNGTQYLQHIDMRYTIAGQLKSINNPGNLVDEHDTGKMDAFAMALWYEDSANSSATPRYNGKISAATWQTKVPSLLSGVIAQDEKTFAYQYDQLGRLIDGRFSSASLPNTFREQATYDNLGNVQTMMRKNKQGDEQHNLAYSYSTAGVRSNKLASVTDTGSEGISSNYSYDASGNLKSDSRKLISNILYNDYGLIDEVQFSDNRLLKYYYDADGNKLQTDVVIGSNRISRYYTEDFEYGNDGNLLFCWTPSGRLVPTGTGFSLEYFINDHNGSLRAIISDRNNNGQLDADEVFDLRDYYPFGSQLAYGGNILPATLNGYGFGGKEGQELTGLLDFGARQYDAVLGRWTGADPLAEMEYSLTMYRYAFNDPINFTDPTGLWEGPDDPEDYDYVGEETFAYKERLKEVNILGYRMGMQDRMEFRNKYGYPMDHYTDGRPDYQVQNYLSAYKAIHDQPPIELYYIEAVSFLTGAGETIELAQISVALAKSAYKYAAKKVALQLAKGAAKKMAVKAAAKGGTEGGLNLFKFGKPTTTTAEGWKTGDRMLKMFDQGSPKLNWKQNSGFLRREMRSGNPIFDSYRYPNGQQIPTGGFLNAERKLLESRGWIYNPSTGAYHLP
jgi:RHS repeat-associated protein